MSVTTTHRPASTDEIAAEIDRRGQIIERLETRNNELEKTLRGTERAIAEFYRYHTGGEMRGSYDGRPEREGLWRAMYAARSTLSSLSPAPQPVGEVRDGWKLVPVEPTDGMIEQAEDALAERIGLGMRIYASDVWRDMLSASPSPAVIPLAQQVKEDGNEQR